MARPQNRAVPRYRFDEFILSPRRRVLLRGGQEQRLIPRYFDLLLFLIERRHEAVHRRDIFERVWTDVVVSDSALSQAIRTIRRTLEDDSREPRFIRTVSRHGYRFVYGDVTEEDDDASWLDAAAAIVESQAVPEALEDRFEPLLQRLTRAPNGAADEEDRREAAELLHGLGTEEALRRLGTRPRHVSARAVLRDTRWDTPGAGAVPIVGAPAPVSVSAALVGIRLRRAARVATARWVSAAVGGGLAGAAAGVVGGLLLALAPDSTSPLSLVPVLALIGGAAGAAGGAGVGAGVSMAETIARSQRIAAIVCGATLGGGLIGAIAQWLSRWSLEAIVGLHVGVGGGLEGLIIGAAAGLGFAVATPRAAGGLAAPRGRSRLNVTLVTAIACGAGGLILTLVGRPLVGGTIHTIAQASRSSEALLTPLGRLVGEPDFGPISRMVIGTGEAALFGAGLALGLTHRRKV